MFGYTPRQIRNIMLYKNWQKFTKHSAYDLWNMEILQYSVIWKLHLAIEKYHDTKWTCIIEFSLSLLWSPGAGLKTKWGFLAGSPEADPCWPDFKDSQIYTIKILTIG